MLSNIKEDKMSRLFLILICLLAATSIGCTHMTPIKSVENVTVYSTFEDKIPGKFAIIVEQARDSLDRTVEPASHLCGGWSYPLEFTSSFTTSLVTTSSYIFEQATRAYSSDIPTLRQNGFTGYVLISIKHFEPRLQFIPKMFAATATADANLGFDYTVKNLDNKTIASGVVSASRTADGEAGGICERGSDLLQTAVRNALQTSLEQYAERLANSEKIRLEFIQKKQSRRAIKSS
jgi:hypothetical protein